MSKAKTGPHKLTSIRIPKPTYDRLIRISADRSIKTGKTISVNSLILEAVEQNLNAA